MSAILFHLVPNPVICVYLVYSPSRCGGKIATVVNIFDLIILPLIVNPNYCF
jgi:hypothetical protein